MQTARLTQEYYGFMLQPGVSRTGTGADKPEANPPRPAVLPAERVVEGELLRKRSAPAGDSLDQILQRGRFANSTANSPDTTISGQAAQRAVSAYRDTAAIPNSSSGGSQPRAIDYYA